MATTVTVKASGGDYTTIQAAVDNFTGASGEYIVQLDDTGLWSESNIIIDEGSGSAIGTRLVIETSPAARGDGTPGSGGYLKGTTSAEHVIISRDDHVEIRWIEVWQDSTGDSDECIRFDLAGGPSPMRGYVHHCILHGRGAAGVGNQDGIYIPNRSTGGPYTGDAFYVDNCSFFDFGRTAIHPQGTNNIQHDIDVYIDHCSVYNVGLLAPANAPGGFVTIWNEHISGTTTVHINNSWCDHNSGDADADVIGVATSSDGAEVWTGAFNCGNDTTLADQGIGPTSLSSKSASETSTADDVIMIQDLSVASGDRDLRPLAPTTGTSVILNTCPAVPERETTIQDFSVDLAGNPRPTVGPTDMGAFHLQSSRPALAVVGSISYTEATLAQTTETSKVITVPSYVPRDTILFLSIRAQSTTPRSEGLRAEKTLTGGDPDAASTSVTVRRDAADVSCTVAVTLVRFSQGVVVNDYAKTDSGTQAITSVGTLVNAFIVPMGAELKGTTYDAGDTVELDFNSTSEVQVNEGAADSGRVTEFQVVQYNGCVVQRLDMAEASWATTSYTINANTDFSPVDADKALLVASTTMSTLSGQADDQYTQMTLNAAGDTVTVSRQGNATTTVAGTCFLVEFTDLTGVSRVAHSENAAEKSVAVPNWGPYSSALMSGAWSVFGICCPESANTANDTAFNLVVPPGATTGGTSVSSAVPLVNATTNAIEDHTFTLQVAHWNRFDGDTPAEAVVVRPLTTEDSDVTRRYHFPELKGATVKGAYFLVSAYKPEDPTNDDGMMGGGVSDGTNEHSYAAASTGGAGTTDIRSVRLTDAAVVLVDPGSPTDTMYADATFGAGWVDLAWQSTFTAKFTITMEAFAGADVQAHAALGVIPINSTAGNGVSITSASFEPNFTRTMTVQETGQTKASHSTNAAGTEFSTGVAYADGGADPPPQFGHAWEWVNGAGTEAHHGGLYNDRVGRLSDGGGRDPTPEVASFLSNGVDIDNQNDTNAGGAYQVGVLLVRFESASLWAGSFQSPTSTQTDNITAPGFQPDSLVVLGSKRTGFDSSDPFNVNTDDAESRSFGMIDADGFEGALVGTYDYNNGTTQAEDSLQSSGVLVLQGSSKATEIEGGLALQSSGFDVTWSTVMGSARQMWAYALRTSAAPTAVAAPLASRTLTGLAPSAVGTEGTLVPDGDNSIAGFTLSAGGDAWDLVNEDPASPTADNIVNSGAATATAKFTLTDTSSDFESAQSVLVDVVLRKR